MLGQIMLNIINTWKVEIIIANVYFHPPPKFQRYQTLYLIKFYGLPVNTYGSMLQVLFIVGLMCHVVMDCVAWPAPAAASWH